METTYVIKRPNLDPLEICDRVVAELRAEYPEDIIAVDRNPRQPIIFFRDAAVKVIPQRS